MNQARRFRAWLRHLEPRVLATLSSPTLGRLRPWLDRHDVFSFYREPLSRGVAIGVLCGLIPGPLQVLGSLGMCAWLRGNAILAVLVTAYTNPLTIVPLYWLAFKMGAFLLPGQHVMPAFVAPDDGFGAWAIGLGEWMTALGWPLLIGLPVLAIVLAANAYALMQVFFLTPVVRRARRLHRRPS
ncbi:DUF2062 domain-containing protein [Rhodoferax antarcticus]|nr:DUF2062 domain-containing protein [Rhodoferax antarcticus]APW48107.1 hypothetical protein RA876_00645 [Rhodoferax antarcticus]MCW2313565.1 uncharacterized protein (DUF2062 family) [Rhodoferax antarcticus]